MTPSRFFFILIVLTTTVVANAQLRVAKIFSDHMVLQRETGLVIWGWSKPKEMISLTFSGDEYKAKSDKSGFWQVELPPMQAGGPHLMQVSNDQSFLEFQDIMIGDVWVCSGQSNMEWPVSKSNNATEEIAVAKDSFIRHFKVPRTTAKDPADDLEGGTWEVTSPRTVKDFTAVGYHFAKELRKHTDVPIGLLNSTWGGSRLEPWMSREALDIKSYDEILAFYENQRKQELYAVYARIKGKVGGLTKEEAGIVEGRAEWADPNHNIDDWGTMKLPTIWEESGFDDLDGSVWFRTAFELTEAEANSDAKLSLAMIDDSDITWVNGKQVGGLEMAWDTPREYVVPSDVLKPGTNILVVRVEDVMGGGGIYGKPEDLFIATSERRLSLAGDWNFKIGYFLFRWEPFDNQVPTILYNKMIYPLLSYSVKGVIWYQGESNATDEDAFAYRDLFPQMINQWRQDWKNSEMPFLWVQLANFKQPDEVPSESYWALLRESQSKTLKLPHTAQAIIIDIGEADDIHPRNKQDVGYRLALGARKIAYDQSIVHSGPVYQSHEVLDRSIRVRFDHVGDGLEIRDKYGYLKGFAIAGEDRKFVWAQARIEGNQVVVWSDEISDPVAVRYAWGDNPDDANLYNVAGLPASPFRTDIWQ